MSVQVPPTFAATAATPKVSPAASRVTPHARRAALVLHAMPPADREWLMDQMPAAERVVLRTLLDELKALGIPRDRGVLDEVMTAHHDEWPGSGSPLNKTSTAQRDDTAEPFALLERADPERLSAVLRDEPDRLIAHLLKLRDWSWRQGLLRRLGKVKRRRVDEQLARLEDSEAGDARVGTANAAALREHLVAAVFRRLQPGDGASLGQLRSRPGSGRDSRGGASAEIPALESRAWRRWFSREGDQP